MALILLGGSVAAASGSLGGTVFSRNRTGAYMRNRTIPLNPNTNFQQDVRNSLTSLVTAWIETLTDAQRTGWTNYGIQVPTTNKLGQPQTLTGQNWFIACNTPRLQAGLPQVNDAPTVFDRGTFTPTTISFNTIGDAVDVDFTNTDAWANEDNSSMLVYAGPPQNASAQFRKASFRYIGEIAGDAVTPPTSPGSLVSSFPLIALARCFARIVVSRADGRLSTAQQLTAIVE